METNNHQLTDYSAILDKEYGAPGTPERAKFDEEAYAFYTSQILLDARKEAKVSQSELAKRPNLIFRALRMDWSYLAWRPSIVL